jgi:hypothetical protein
MILRRLCFGSRNGKNSIGTSIQISSDQFNTAHYSGLLIQFTRSFTGPPEFNRSCKEWVTIKNNTGFGIMMCSKQYQWPSIEDYDEQMLDSFVIE